jgi:hypothetical protein
MTIEDEMEKPVRFIVLDAPERPVRFRLIDDKPPAKKRKTVEYNGMELLCALLFVYADLTLENLEDCIANEKKLYHSAREEGVWCENFDSFKTDLLSKKEKIPDYIRNFTFPPDVSREMIRRVILCGKYFTHPDIVTLNQSFDRKHAKADIYIQLVDNSWIGISVKQSEEATKTNFSVQKLLGDKSLDSELTKIRTDYLVKNGFPTHDKLKRDSVNKLFYPENPENPTNPYWNRVLSEIEIKKKEVLTGIIEPMFCREIPYPMYEYDGKHLICLNYNLLDLSQISLKHHLSYYYDTKGALRTCAKIFFQLCVFEKKYRVEVRWKGNVHSASPQFQVHPHLE